VGTKPVFDAFALEIPAEFLIVCPDQRKQSRSTWQNSRRCMVKDIGSFFVGGRSARLSGREGARRAFR